MSTQLIIDPTATRRTIYGSKHQTAMTLGMPVPYQEKETLNELHNFLVGETPAAGTYSALNYYQFGINGAYMKSTSDGRQELESYVHQPTHGGLFYPIPFVLRRLDNDLTPAQREYYAGRSTANYGGVDYIAYWLAPLDKTETQIEMKIKDSVNGTEREFVPSTDTLQPTPQRPSIDDENIVSGEYCVVESLVGMSLKAWQLDELINAKEIITGSSSLDINEIAICLGQPKVIQIQDGENLVNFKEAIVVQPTAYFPNRHNLNAYLGQDFGMRFNAGIDDPLSLAVADLS